MPRNNLFFVFRWTIFFVIIAIGTIFDSANALLPDELVLTVVANGEELAVELYRRSVRTEDYTLRLWNSQNGYFTSTPTEIRTYRGTVVGKPNQIVVGAIFP